MKKKLLAFLITCVMITGVISTNYMNTHALAAGATYTAYELISMIFAVVGGTTIERQQGLMSDGQFNANALYESMNTKSPGIGSLLSSYVNRAQYLNPGSDLIMSESDYEEFLQYFRNYNMESTISGQIDSGSIQDFKQKLENFTGITLSNIPQVVVDNINSGQYKHIIKFKEYDGTNTGANSENAFVICGDYTITLFSQTQTETLYIIRCTSPYCFYRTYWAVDQPTGVGVVTWGETYGAVKIFGGIGYKADSSVNGKIKNGTYDTVSKSRTWDATQGKLVGHTTITMPATETLDEAINAENVKDITDAVNVYPVDTTDDTMIYYPSQSVEDFMVPSITINPSITFPGVDGNISDYTVTLTDFFPFCIPWDIYDMLSAFVTTPETPEFTFRFPTGVINHQIQWTECTFDLHAWDGVASALRTIELISFAIGLGLMTRNIFLRG